MPRSSSNQSFHGGLNVAFINISGRAVFGSLLSVSLASVLFQDSVWLALIFVYILFSNWEILNYRVKGIYNWIQRRMNKRNLLPV
ncbi:hypothetical protein Acr_15g0005750 [Actinidia rufa]|uniref:Uncharacterized protein n=1 Tax=Actinidia rufa TaxID=165716 RepID=A0A7J0FTC3_9ERIC|nr:hypothetical protein Acr_15g0005750 [Actinidia rufa]